MDEVRGAPCSAERGARWSAGAGPLKNRILLENCSLPGALEAQVGA